MTFTRITFVYLVAYIIHQGTALVIEFLNARYMRDRIGRMPEHFIGRMDPESYRRAIRYNLAAPVTYPAFAALNFTHPDPYERIAAIRRIVLD